MFVDEILAHYLLALFQSVLTHTRLRAHIVIDCEACNQHAEANQSRGSLRSDRRQW